MQPEQSPAWVNPHEAEGYIVDHYSVLNVSRTAGQDEIQSAFRALMKQYHPDLLNQLGDRCPPEFKKIAAERSGLYTRAYEVLSDQEKKAAYDRALSNWEGPISENGSPILSLFARRFNPIVLLGSSEARDAAIEGYRRQAQEMSGFNPETHAKLQAAVEADPNCPEVLKTALADSLEREEVYLSVLQDRIEQEMGIVNNTIGISSERWLASTEEKLGEVRAKLSAQVTTALLDVAEGRLQLGGAQGNTIEAQLKEERALALTALSEQALGEADRLIEKTKSVAKDREANLTQRLSLLQPDYDPKPSSYSPRVIVIIKMGKEDPGTTLPFELIQEADGQRWCSAQDSSELELTRIQDAEYRRGLIDKGWNILTLQTESFPVKAALEQVLTVHASLCDKE